MLQKKLDALKKQVQDNDPSQQSAVTRNGNKIGRNDPCPCGSGKKYKGCCGV